jgi:hypothetical protein
MADSGGADSLLTDLSASSLFCTISKQLGTIRMDPDFECYQCLCSFGSKLYSWAPPFHQPSDSSIQQPVYPSSHLSTFLAAYPDSTDGILGRLYALSSCLVDRLLPCLMY